MEISIAKKIWKGLFFLLLLCALFIGVQLGRELKKFFILRAKTKVELDSWKAVEVEPDHFSPAVSYQFAVGDQTFSGEYFFERTVFPNEAACLAKVERFEKLPWDVYFSPGNPEVASLQKNFPFKKSVHMLLVLAVLGYFVWFRGYLQNTY